MKKILEMLDGSPFFQGINPDQVESVLNCVSARKISKESGQFILRAGDTTGSMGLMLSGTALVIQEDVWGHRNVISKVEQGEFFAETFAATRGAVLNVSVVAETDCQILTMNMDKLLTVCSSSCQQHNTLIHNLVSVLAEKILIMNDKITHMSKRTTRDKLLSYLSSEAIKHGSKAFYIPYDRQQLADYLCVERAAMSVELSKLQKEGVLETKRNYFVLSDS